MQKKYGLILSVIIIIFLTVFMIRCTNNMHYKEITYDILSYEEAPEFVRDSIEKELGASTMKIYGSDGYYIVLVPPEDKAVNVFFVGEDKSYGHGVVYKYTYVDKVSDDILHNIKIIKVSNYGGNLVGIFVSKKD